MGLRLVFKIAESKFFLKQKLIINSAILNKWEFFSEMVDKWRSPLWELYNFLFFRFYS